MIPRNSRIEPPGESLLVALALITLTEPAWAIFGVWRRSGSTYRRGRGHCRRHRSGCRQRQRACLTGGRCGRGCPAICTLCRVGRRGPTSGGVGFAAANPPKSPQQKLRELQSLYDQKLITASDYQASKQKILNEMTQ